MCLPTITVAFVNTGFTQWPHCRFTLSSAQWALLTDWHKRLVDISEDRNHEIVPSSRTKFLLHVIKRVQTYTYNFIFVSEINLKAIWFLITAL
jgi:hypothetical protein